MNTCWFPRICPTLRKVTSYTTNSSPINKDLRPLACIQKTLGGTSQRSSNFMGNVVHVSSIRAFGRKAGKMGQHLQKLDKGAHRLEHYEAKDKRKKKLSDNHGSENVDDLVNDLEEDEYETIFDTVVSNDDADELPPLPSTHDVEERMMKVVSAMEKSFRSIRGAEPSPDLFDSLQVNAYGAWSPLSAVAQVVITSPTQANIACFDPATTQSVRDAVRDMGMNFNPIIEEGDVVVPIPRVSAETRKAIVKQLGKTAESTRQRVRRIRRGAQDVVKKGKDGKLGPGISKDDAFRVGKEVDDATEKCIQALNTVLRKKEDSVMAV